MEFRVLGPLEVVDGDHAVELGGPRQRALLAYLLVHANEAVAAERLIEELWGGSASGANALQVSVSRLRKALGGDDRLLTQPAGYLLRVAPEEFDRELFEQLFDEARRDMDRGDADEAADTLRRALALWRGHPLADSRYEPFAQAEIARLEELRLSCLEARIDADLALGRHAELVSELEALTREQPLRQRPHAQLMLALYRTGRHADALEIYQATRRHLVEELGIEPSSKLRELHQAILRQDTELDLPQAPIAVEPADAPAPAPEPPSPAPALRKTVTVLVTGTAQPASAAALDPELRKRLGDRAFSEVAPVLERHGATVERLLDGRVMAVFGMPATHEDDALRAVRAAVELRDTFAGRPEGVYTGIDSGEVLTGDTVSGEPLVMGAAIETAAALQEASGPGEIILGAATHRLVRQTVTSEPVELGDGRPQAWRVHELVPGAPPFLRRFDALLVGRDGELSQLRQAFERARRERRAQLFTVLGEAGIGKTRLARELASRLAGEARVLSGRCLSYGEGITYWPLREIVEQAAGGRTLTDVLAGEERAEVIAERLGAALGQAEVAVAAEETFWAFRKLFEALAGERPLVLCFEDVHWGEPTLLDLVEHLADWIREAPVLLVCLARPELFEVRPGWGGGKVNSTSILLEPLSQADSTALARELGAELPEETRQRAIVAAAGNPLFLEQMLAMLTQDRGVDGAIVLPPAIQALLASRLERLPAEERHLLGRASVEGESFHVGAVVALSPAAGRPLVEALLSELVRKELVQPDRPVVAGEDAFRFRHALIRDAAYEAVTKEQRSQLHERLAGWLEQTFGDRATEAEEFLGYHLEQAYRYRSELHGVDEEALELANRARRSLTAAARSAFRRGDTRAVVNLLERARALPASDERSRLELAPDLGFALFQAGELDRAESVLSETIERAKGLGERQTERHAWLVRESSRLFRQPEPLDLAKSLREGQESLAVLAEAGDDIALVRAWNFLRLLYACTGDEAARREAGERALEHARRAGSRLDEALSLALLGWLLVEGPTPVDEGIRISERLLRELAHDPLGEATIASIALANLIAMQGRFQDARMVLARSRAEGREFGLGLFRNVVELLGGGRVETRTGDLQAAERTTRAAAERSAEIGDNWLYVLASIDLARTVCDLGRPAESLEILEESEQHPAPPDIDIVVKRATTRALALARLGRFENAEPMAREAVSYAGGTQFLGFHAEALLVLAEVLRRDGRPAEATAALEDAVALFERKGNIVAVAKAQTLLVELRSASGGLT